MTDKLKTPTTSRNYKLIPLALSLMATLAMGGCVTTGPISVARTLPPAPSKLMRPVPVPNLVKGMDARAALRLTGTALIEANYRLSASAGWYEGVRKSYAAGR